MDNTQPKTFFQKGSMMIPVAIIIAGVLIAAAVIFSNQGSKSQKVADNPAQEAQAPQESGSLDSISPVTAEDHILGSPDAPVKIVEYSDAECPFCKRFHSTMQQVMEEYGKDGKVAWIYRHFPLDSLHPRNARKTAVASECAGGIAGNTAFWAFTDRFFELTPSNDQTDIATIIPQILGEIGIDQSEFDKCAESGKYDKHIQDNIDNAIATGGRGTPWSIMIAGSGEMFPINGAQPYNVVKQLIDIALEE